MPTPGTEFEIKLVSWIVASGFTGLFALVTFFLVRYVRQTDGKFKNLDSKIDESLTKFSSEADKFHDTSRTLQHSVVEFQMTINREMLELSQQALQIEKTLVRTQDKADRLEHKMDATIEKVDVFGARLAEHDRQLKKTMKQVDGHTGEIESLHKEVGNLRIVNPR